MWYESGVEKSTQHWIKYAAVFLIYKGVKCRPKSGISFYKHFSSKQSKICNKNNNFSDSVL